MKIVIELDSSLSPREEALTKAICKTMSEFGRAEKPKTDEKANKDDTVEVSEDKVYPNKTMEELRGKALAAKKQNPDILTHIKDAYGVTHITRIDPSLYGEAYAKLDEAMNNDKA